MSKNSQSPKKPTKMSKIRQKIHKKVKKPSKIPQKPSKIFKNLQKKAKHIGKPSTILENHKKRTKTSKNCHETDKIAERLAKMSKTRRKC